MYPTVKSSYQVTCVGGWKYSGGFKANMTFTSLVAYIQEATVKKLWITKKKTSNPQFGKRLPKPIPVRSSHKQIQEAGRLNTHMVIVIKQNVHVIHLAHPVIVPCWIWPVLCHKQ